MKKVNRHLAIIASGLMMTAAVPADLVTSTTIPNNDITALRTDDENIEPIRQNCIAVGYQQ